VENDPKKLLAGENGAWLGDETSSPISRKGVGVQNLVISVRKIDTNGPTAKKKQSKRKG